MMTKCDCYHTETKRRYTYNPITGDPIGHDVEVGVCWGTKECDECSCGGDETKCDFYPEVREKARKKRKPKFGEWISVEDRLPDKDGKYLCCWGKGEYISIYSFAKNLRKVDKYDFQGQNRKGWYDYDSEWGYGEKCGVTHWMHLPEPPKGDNNDK